MGSTPAQQSSCLCKTGILLAKGFCRAKFWAKFPFWRGAVRDEVFREVCGEVFHEVSGLFCWDIQSKKTSAKASALNPHDSAQQNWRSFRENFMTRFCRGTLARFSSNIVYFLSSLRARTAKTLICTKSGVSADSRKSAKKCTKLHFLCKKCVKSAQKVRFGALFGALSGIGGNPTFCAD